MEIVYIILLVLAFVLVLGLMMGIVAKIYKIDVDKEIDDMPEKSAAIYISLFPLFVVYKFERGVVKKICLLFKKR